MDTKNADTKKTISYLNSKAWYRFLKVVFIFIFLAIILIANRIHINYSIGQISQSKTFIYCNGGDKRVLTASQALVHFSNHEFINGFDYKNFYEDDNNEYRIKAILRACYDEVNNEAYEDVYLVYDDADGDIYAMQRAYEIAGFKANRKKFDEDYLKEQFEIMKESYKSNSQKRSYLDYSVHLFDIKPAYIYRTTIKDFILYFFIINFVILLIFEVLRRVFYYIVLGTIRPKKR